MSVTPPLYVKRISLIGLGTVGMGWTANYLAKGYNVVATDPAPDAEAKTRHFLKHARPMLEAIGIVASDDQFGTLTVAPSVEVAVSGAHVIHESGPEDLDMKRSIISEIEQFADSRCLIASSSGGIPPTSLQDEMRHPDRFMVVHPFNPPHLIPLVEVIPGSKTDPSMAASVIDLMHQIGKHPILIDKEKTAYLTNRLQFALLREAIFCLSEGVATARAIEDAVQFGLAPRWVAMGPLSTLTLAGGAGGMEGLLKKFGPAIERWWSDLGNPTLTPSVCEALLRASQDLFGNREIDSIVSERDRALVSVISASTKTSVDNPFEGAQ